MLTWGKTKARGGQLELVGALRVGCVLGRGAVSAAGIWTAFPDGALTCRMRPGPIWELGAPDLSAPGAPCSLSAQVLVMGGCVVIFSNRARWDAAPCGPITLSWEGCPGRGGSYPSCLFLRSGG